MFKKKHAFAIASAIALVGFFVVFIAIIYCGKDEREMQQINTVLREQVLKGDSKEKVEAIIDQMSWEPSYFESGTDELDQWGGKSVAEHAGIDKRDIAFWIRVTIERDSLSTTWPKCGGIWPKRLVVYFLFDKESKLIQCFWNDEQVMS